MTEGQHFVQLEEISSESLQIKDTLKEWVDSVPDEKLELIFDLFFGTIMESGIHLSTICPLQCHRAHSPIISQAQAQTLEPEQVETLKIWHNSC